jgi:hypothetical protein
MEGLIALLVLLLFLWGVWAVLRLMFRTLARAIAKSEQLSIESNTRHGSPARPAMSSRTSLSLPAKPPSKVSPLPAPTHHLTYQGANGEQTQRAITLTVPAHRDFGEEVYIKALCHLRREPRSFRRDRIVAVADPQTGEIMGAPRDVFRVRGEASFATYPDHDRIVARMQHGLTILIWVAKTEDGIDDAEFADIDRFVTEQAKRMRSRIGRHDPRALRETLEDVESNLTEVKTAIAIIKRPERSAVLKLARAWMSRIPADTSTRQRLASVVALLEGWTRVEDEARIQKKQSAHKSE